MSLPLGHRGRLAAERVSPGGLSPARRAALDLSLLALWLLLTLGLRPLTLPDEGRYAGVALEMLQRHSLVPTLDGLPYFHKPPLLYALDALAMGFLGVHAAAARLGPMLLAWGGAAATYLHLRRAHGEDTARLGLVILATMPLYYFGAQYVNHDVGVAACITATVLCVLRSLPAAARTGARAAAPTPTSAPAETAGSDARAPRPDPRWVAAAWACAGLGLLAKGLIGLVLPVLIVAPWLAAQRRGRELAGLVTPTGVLALLAVAGPWFAAMQWRHPGFWDYFVVEQHFRRYAGTGFNNVRPFWFLVVALPLLGLPWSLWAARRPGVLREPLGALYGWWVVVVLAFFSWPASKLVGYVLPAAPPLAMWLALALRGQARAARALALTAALLCLAAVAVLAGRPFPTHAAMGRVLAARWQAGDRLVYLDAPYFDLRFHAGIAAPAIVLSDWRDPALDRQDSWRKELRDAGRFAPEAAAATLWTWDRLPELGCGARRVWLVTAPDARPLLAALPAALPAAATGLETAYADARDQLLLWARPTCPLTP